MPDIKKQWQKRNEKDRRASKMELDLASQKLGNSFTKPDLQIINQAVYSR